MSLTAITLLLTSLIAVAFVAWLRCRPLRRQMFRNCGPTIERLQYEMSLVTLRVPICDIVDARLSSRFGTACVSLLVKGDVEIVIDCREARLPTHDDRPFTVHLLPPRPRRPRLDHERLVVHSIRRSFFAPRPEEAVNYALKVAQRIIENAAHSEDLIEEARASASQHVTRLFRHLGDSVQIKWLDDVKSDSKNIGDRLSQGITMQENEVCRPAA